MKIWMFITGCVLSLIAGLLIRQHPMLATLLALNGGLLVGLSA